MRLLKRPGQSLTVLVAAGAMLLLAGRPPLGSDDQSEPTDWIGISRSFGVGERSGKAATRPGPQGGNAPPLATEGG